MKVVLLKDIKKIGKKLDVVEVSDGYAKNYLIPKGLASLATNKNVSEASSKQDAIKFKKQTEYDTSIELKEKIENLCLEFRLKSYENGRLFGSITTKELAEELEKKLNSKIDKRKIDIEAVKQIGTYEAKVKLYEKVIAKLKFKVVGI